VEQWKYFFVKHDFNHGLQSHHNNPISLFLPAENKPPVSAAGAAVQKILEKGLKKKLVE